LPPLRIAIDASRTTIAARTGTENYALQLIRALLDLHPPHRITLYFRERSRPGLFPDYPNVKHEVIEVPRLWTHVGFAAALWADRPDVTFVPAHSLPFIFPGKAIATIHDLGYRFFPEAHPGFERRYLDLTTRTTARRATRILADSEATRRDLVSQYGVDAGKIDVVYPGVEGLRRATDEQIAAVKAKYGLPDRYVLFLGTLQPRKNIKRLIEAFVCYVQNHVEDDISLVLAGKRGWLIEDVLSEVHNTHKSHIVMPGYVADEDVAAVYSGALALVFPSLYEGFGFPVLEAMRCGTPVLCSNTSSLPELAGDAALLVDPLDVRAIADGMARLVSDSALRSDLTARGYHQAKQFTWRRAAQQTLAVLERTGYE
jgi:glycosyltransferase involved in cell wall biosynthesis